MKKKIKIRLYRLHDKDLLSLAGTRMFDFQKNIYLALKAFCNQEDFAINLPAKRNIPIPKEQRGYVKILTLDTEKDADIIEMLDMINDGYRNNFIKNVLRLYIRCPITEEFLIDANNESYFEKRYNILHQQPKVNTDAPLKQPTSSEPKETVTPTAKAIPLSDKRTEEIGKVKETVNDTPSVAASLSQEESMDLMALMDAL